jgi:hypothetical protein
MPIALLFVAATLLPAFAHAAPAAPAPGAPAAENPSVSVTVLGIRATAEEKPHVDADLQPIADELKRSKFNSFKLVARDTRPVVVGAATEFALVEDWALRVKADAAQADKVRITVTWICYTKGADGQRKGEVKLEVPMELRKGKYFLSGGWKLKDGSLMGAVAVK